MFRVDSLMTCESHFWCDALCLRLRVCVFVCVFVCLFVSVCLCMCICVCVFMYVYLCLCVRCTVCGQANCGGLDGLHTGLAERPQ